MKLYVDDVRTPEDNTWVIARNYWDAIHILKNCEVAVLSLDHDLGDGPTGYDIIRWLDEGLHQDFPFFEISPPKTILCHSANPVGRERILAGVSAMQDYMESLIVGWGHPTKP